MEDIGEIGFWLAVGIVIAAWILSSGLKEREKERQTQETLRALLTTEGVEGKNTTEILAYMRERDAVEQKRDVELRAAMNRSARKVLAVLAAIVAALVVFLIGVRIVNGAEVKGALQLAPLVLPPLVAFLVYVLIRGKKNVPPSGA